MPAAPGTDGLPQPIKASGIKQSLKKETWRHRSWAYICNELMATASCPKEALHDSMELLSDLGLWPYRVFRTSAGVARCAPDGDVNVPVLARPSTDVI